MLRKQTEHANEIVPAVDMQTLMDSSFIFFFMPRILKIFKEIQEQGGANFKSSDIDCNVLTNERGRFKLPKDTLELNQKFYSDICKQSIHS